MAKNRHLSRTVCMQTLYEYDFRNSTDISEIAKRNIKEFEKDLDVDYVYKIINGAIEKWDEINKLIEEAAPEWPLGQIARVDKNTLRVAIYEMVFDKDQDVPPRVSINEAIELGKTFGSETSSKFINGVLGFVYRKYEAEMQERDKA